MNCTDWNEKLHDYVDGELSAAVARAVEAHVVSCAACRGALDSLRALRAATAALDREITPRRELWPEIAARLAPARAAHGTRERAALGRASGRHSPLAWLAPFAIAASIALLAGVAERRIPAFKTRGGWEVATVSGAPRIAAQLVQGDTRLGVGQWLETDNASRARVSVASIGEVRLEPNSRLRLVQTSATDHRVELARGTLHALIWAPPRLFFVETPGATAVDLGCAYTLTVDREGGGVLEVTSGYVALEHQGRESIIRSGFKCLTRARQGPGTPFAADAPEPLQAALARLDFSRNAGAAALATVLEHARADDAITLWHLLTRPDPAQRARVFDALAKFQPPPAGVTREGIGAGDAAMRRAWADELGIGTFAGR